jgi:hypothetical protein
MKLKLSLFIVLFVGNHLYGQIGAQHSFNFVHLPHSSQIAALGGNALAFYDKASLPLALNNPSLLGPQFNNQFTLSHIAYMGGIQAGNIGYAKYISKKQQLSAAFQLQYVNYGGFQRANAEGEKQGNFSAAEYGFGAGLGKKLGNFNYGLNAKYSMSFYDQSLATAITSDLATTYVDTVHHWQASLMIKAMGAILKPLSGRQHDNTSWEETTPWDVQFGFSKRLKHIPLTINFVAHHLQQFDIRYDNLADANSSNQLINNTEAPIKEKKYITDKIARHIIIGGQLNLSKAVAIQLGYNHLRRMELKNEVRNGVIGFNYGLQINTKKINFGISRSHFYFGKASYQFNFSTNIHRKRQL